MKCANKGCDGVTKTLETVPDNELPAIFRRLVCKKCGSERTSFESYVEDPEYKIPRGLRTNRRKSGRSEVPITTHKLENQPELPNIDQPQEVTDADTTSAGNGESPDSVGEPAANVQGQAL